MLPRLTVLHAVYMHDMLHTGAHGHRMLGLVHPGSHRCRCTSVAAPAFLCQYTRLGGLW